MALKFFFDRKKMYVYPWYISDLVATKDMAKITKGPVVKQTMGIIEKDHLSFYFDSESTLKVGRFLFNKIKKDKKFYQRCLRNIYKYSQQLIDFSNSVKRVDKLSDKELLKLYQDYRKILRKTRAWGWIPVFVDGLEKNFLSDEINKQLKKNIPKNTSKYYSILSSSEKQSEVQKAQIARLNLLINKGSLDNYLKKYSWLTYAYSGPIMDKKLLKKLLAEDKKSGDPKKQKQKILRHYKDITKQKQEIIKKFNLPRNLVYLLEVSSEFMHIKDYRKGAYQKSYVAMDKVFAEFSHRLDIPVKNLKYLIFPELKDALLNSNAELYRNVTKTRLKKCCFYITRGQVKIYQGSECEKQIKKRTKKTKKKVSKQKILKGMTAYAGKVRGQAKIVLVENDVKKVKKGDILVSSATNPDLIVAMKKAGAFVTDTGGIISHAAIISRELKKPCVVGTTTGTQIIKDNDLVEVDANKGIVTIL